MEKETCTTCKFFDYKIKGAFGDCLRYPRAERKSKSGWCGEHQKEEKEDAS
ncbi:MAG: hypothetical protein J7L96_03510 [Bacteroidales bacterium]|nr:hypothetical protein [Bacteroidales bacterium]